MADFRYVLPGKLRLPPTRPEGADDYKLAMQEIESGSSTEGMPSIEVLLGSDGQMIIFNGVTCAIRAYRYHPNTPVLVEVTDVVLSVNLSRYKTIGEVHDEQNDPE